jgi:large subunit ribosomal protein L22e
LGETVKVSTEKSRITVQAEGAFSKRYLKYLAKKFLKKNHTKDYLRLVSTNKSTYELKYYNIQDNDNEENDD